MSKIGDLNADKINHVLDLLEKQNSNNWLDVVSTILLSLATILSTWCIYKSSQWNGEQYFHIDDENMANQLRVQYETAINHRKLGEIQFFLQYVSAVSNKDVK